MRARHTFQRRRSSLACHEVIKGLDGVALVPLLDCGPGATHSALLEVEPVHLLPRDEDGVPEGVVEGVDHAVLDLREAMERPLEPEGVRQQDLALVILGAIRHRIEKALDVLVLRHVSDELLTLRVGVDATVLASANASAVPLVLDGNRRRELGVLELPADVDDDAKPVPLVLVASWVKESCGHLTKLHLVDRLQAQKDHLQHEIAPPLRDLGPLTNLQAPGPAAVPEQILDELIAADDVRVPVEILALAKSCPFTNLLQG